MLNIVIYPVVSPFQTLLHWQTQPSGLKLVLRRSPIYIAGLYRNTLLYQAVCKTSVKLMQKA